MVEGWRQNVERSMRNCSREGGHDQWAHTQISQ
jgi:hypothetical protein